MKKTILIIASALCLSVGALHAQDVTPRDTTGNATLPAPTVPEPTQPAQTPSQDFKQDMIKIKANEIPASLKTTLEGAQYKGWDKGGMVYKTKDNNGYVVEMKDGSNKMTTHRFDANGKPIEN